VYRTIIYLHIDASKFATTEEMVESKELPDQDSVRQADQPSPTCFFLGYVISPDGEEEKADIF